ncbi:hypothetical protein FGE12_12390 [Aggregicoccus sp. 17bor-14]|uniref:hypothetical protein n=1 Tax=Myxococcaceae TaxID=31 RepID=UPI00129C49C7|nr:MULTISPECIES: hypothetical protein [Myxococcaceae]MBF5043189.1 hypothetical protein [Simulacricoccus sp. 17bor-14]MRI88947.1 hypothetical protein [Aggregicoccus sp. 17bor-14]
MAATAPSCSSHPAPAGWRCPHCELPLCARCVASKQAQTVRYAVCVRCGGVAEPLQLLRAAHPYAARLRHAWRYPLTREGLVVMALSGLVVWVISHAGNLGSVLAVGVVWSYVFTLILRSAQGDDSLDPPDFSGVLDLVGPAVRGVLSSAVLWLPALLYLLLAAPAPQRGATLESAVPDARGQVELPSSADVDPLVDQQVARVREASERAQAHEDAVDSTLEDGEGDEAAPPTPRAHVPAPRPTAALQEALTPPSGVSLATRAVHDPVVWLLVLLGLLWLPASVASAAAGTPMLQVLNPLQALRFARCIPRDYALAAAATALVLLVGGGVQLVGAGLAMVPVVGAILACALATYAPLVLGRVLGLLLYVRGADLGLMRPEDAYEAVTPVGEPQGQLPEALAQPEHVQRRRAAVELDAAQASPPPAAPRAPAPPRVMGASGLEAAASGASTVLAQEGGAEVAAPVSAAEALRAAVSMGALARALQLYPEAVREPAAALPADCHYAVGRQAAVQGQYPLAVQALRAACAAEPAGPLAPQALVMMARVLGERMGDAAGAQRVYAHVLQHYPASEAARFAKSRLGP